MSAVGVVAVKTLASLAAAVGCSYGVKKILDRYIGAKGTQNITSQSCKSDKSFDSRDNNSDYNLFYLLSLQHIFAKYNVDPSSYNAIDQLVKKSSHTLYKAFLQEALNNSKTIEELYNYVNSYVVKREYSPNTLVSSGPYTTIEKLRSLMSENACVYNEIISPKENVINLIEVCQNKVLSIFRDKFCKQIEQVLSLRHQGIDCSRAFSSLLTDIRMEYTLNNY